MILQIILDTLTLLQILLTKKINKSINTYFKFIDNSLECQLEIPPQQEVINCVSISNCFSPLVI